MKKWNLAIRILIVIIINMSVSTAMHIVGGIAQGEHGAPSFLSPGFTAYGILTSLLLIGAYVLMGYRIPIKNRAIRGITFILLFWLSDYLPQIVGTFGAKSHILAHEAFSVTTITFDTIAYFITGIFLGLLLDKENNRIVHKCSLKRILIACLVSAIVFSGVAFGLEMLLGSIKHEFFAYVAFGIHEEEKVSFYIVLYLCQAFSGLLFPPIYRLTEYNSNHTNKWLYFASIYGLMLWAPIVLIVIFFGVPVLPTIVFTIILVASIYIDSAVFAYLLKIVK